MFLASLALLVLLVEVPAPPNGQPPAPAPLYERAGVRGAREAEPGCVRARLQLPAGAEPTGTVTLKFSVSAEGEPGDFTSAGDSAPLVHEALVTAVRACAWAPGETDGRKVAVWKVMPFKFRDGPKELEAAEQFERTRLVKFARPVKPRCVVDRFRAPEGSLLTGDATVRVQIDADGTVSGVIPTRPFPAGVASALDAAVRACAWLPAEGRDGPVAGSMLFTLRFEGGPAMPPVDPDLAEQAREKDPRCLPDHLAGRLRARWYPMVVITFRVDSEGKASDVTVWPDDVYPDDVLEIVLSVGECRWLPGRGKDGAARASTLVRRYDFAR